MKVTALTTQQIDQNRVNVIVDGVFKCSLDIFQLSELGVRVGKEYTEAELDELLIESQFGKTYARALEYCLMRPHSSREVKDYLYRKMQTKRYRSRRTGEIKEREGISQIVADRVFSRLEQKGYIDDENFARYWVENRNQRKGSSMRKLKAELLQKGVNATTIDKYLSGSVRNDADELRKIITKKRVKYPDEQKFMQYLARQGFSFDDIKEALEQGDV